jgi:CRP/FNR family transcriptional regulator, nitrogen fixation regulation protein
MRDIILEHAASGGGAPVQFDNLFNLGALELPGVRMRFERNEEIFGEGEAAEYVYKVISGAVRAMRFTSDGRRQIMAFYLPGDVFGFDLKDAHGFSAEALAASDILLVRRSAIEKAGSGDVRAARALLELSAAQLHQAQEHAFILGRKGAGERVAAFLLQLAERLCAAGEIDLPMSRSEIADYLALTIETVSRAFSHMEREQMIALPNARHVVVRSRSALANCQAA